MRTDRGPGRPVEPPPPRRPLVTPQMLVGLLIVAFGALLLLDNLDVADADRVLAFWPLGLVAIGVLKLLQPGRGSGRVFGGVLLIAGLGFTAEELLGWPISVDDWWPVLLIGLGVLVLFRARGGARRGGATSTTEEYVSEFATWAGKQRRIASPAFRGADVTAIMGGVELDLRGAATADGEAVLDVFVMWGGVEIFVPPDWAVSNNVTALMGGVEDKSSGMQDATHRLVIRGFVLMGGLEIHT